MRAQNDMLAHSQASWVPLSSRGLALSLSKGALRGRRRIYCSMGSFPSDLHEATPERQHVSLQRCTEAATKAMGPRTSQSVKGLRDTYCPEDGRFFAAL